jgi:hypothetical protein
VPSTVALRAGPIRASSPDPASSPPPEHTSEIEMSERPIPAGKSAQHAEGAASAGDGKDEQGTGDERSDVVIHFSYRPFHANTARSVSGDGSGPTAQSAPAIANSGYSSERRDGAAAAAATAAASAADPVPMERAIDDPESLADKSQISIHR